MAILYNSLKDNFTQIPNELLTDSRLSNGAKVVFCYVASKPTGWKVWNSEIQRALNIKDKGTMSKYWKELLDSGWVSRTRNKSDNGQFSGGYDYELNISPNKEENRIKEKPTLGKTPEHSNTDLISNTNINNNTNNINNKDNKPNKLFSTDSEIKKPKQNKYIEIIQNLCSNQKVRDALLEYCNFRRSRGLTHEQWKLIVSKFKEDSKNKTESEVLNCIQQCIINGRNSLYYSQPNSYNNNKTVNSPHIQNNDSACNELRRSDQF